MCHAQLLSQSMVKAARKRHQCDCCLRFVEKGASYIRTTAIAEGDFQVSKLCLRCQAFVEAYDLELEDGGDYCYSLRDMRDMAREELRGTGLWRRFRKVLREKREAIARGDWRRFR